jgi:hypothetical protein
MRFLIIGGSDEGIAAGLSAHELDPGCEVTLILADKFPSKGIILLRWRQRSCFSCSSPALAPSYGEPNPLRNISDRLQNI